MPSSPKVIVFGAAGAVGRAAALEAKSQGAQVTLAMRNPSKRIAGIDSEDSSFSRVKADLGDLDSVTAAVKESGATVAFTYILPTAEDGLLSAFQAMRQAGITHVVLLSSATIYEYGGEPRDCLGQENPFAVVHAKAELALHESGLTYTALRPMYFASNLKELNDWAAIAKDKVVEVALPHVKMDYISPDDIGTMAGSRMVVAHAAAATTEIIPLCGPHLLTQEEAWKTAARVVGVAEDLEVRPITAQQSREAMLALGWPEPIAKANVLFCVHLDEDPNFMYKPEWYEVASNNFEKYTGRRPMRLEEWMEKHKDEVLV